MKKRILGLAVVSVCFCICFGSTIAYFTSNDIARNVITTGDVSIKIIEKTFNGEQEVEFPEEGFFGIMPGETASKIVSVKNTGPETVWIRAKLELALCTEAGEILPETFHIFGETASVLEYSIENDWIDGEDGYYYYKTFVEPGRTTGILLKEVSFSKDMPNEYQNCIAKINMIAEAVQTVHNPVPSGGSVPDVKGWPKN